MTTRLKHSLLGLVALGLFFGAVFMTWTFLKGGFQGGVPVTAVFSAPGIGQQLPEGGDVKVRGALVGRIHDMELTEDGVNLHLRLDSSEQIPAASFAEIRSKTVFGQKWVELIPPEGDLEGPFLVAGSEIPDSRTVEPLELERELQLGHDLLSELPLSKLATITKTLAEGFAGSEEDAAAAIDEGIKALRTVNTRSGELDLALRQLNEFSAWLADNDEDLLSFMESVDAANRALVGAAPEFISSNQSVPVFLNDLADFQIRIEADLGRLLEDGTDVLELVAARSDRLGSLVRGLQAFTTIWNSGLSQPCAGEFEEDMYCWQVYLMPGLDSRGLYDKGESPLDDEASDPGRPTSPVESPSALDEEALTERFGTETAQVIRRLAEYLFPEETTGVES